MKKLSKRLTDKEALSLGFSLNKKPFQRNKAMYRITEEQWDLVKGGKSKKTVSIELPLGFKPYLSILKGLSTGELENIKDGLVMTPQKRIQHDRTIRVLRSKEKDYKLKYDYLINEYDHLESMYNDSLSVLSTEKPKDIKYKSVGNGSISIPIIQYSDWHVEEVVDFGQTNGLNEYSPEIAKERSIKLARNTCKLIESARQDAIIKDAVIHLGGDFITGWIHDEGRETNAMSPVEASMYATELLTSLITYIEKHSKLERIVFLCSRGNHARMTKKMRFSNERETSLETSVYAYLSRHFKSNKKIEFYVPDSPIGYYKIADKTIRFFHGQQVRYNRGIGGISVSLNRMISYWDKTEKADFNLMGHYHTASMPNPNTMLNGSLVGYNAFAQSFGFACEPPQQTFICYNTKYGFTNFNKIAGY